MNADAINLIRAATLRGTSQLDLVRAATACARAVTPLVVAGNVDVLAAVEATEWWTRNPCEPNATVVLASLTKCLNLDAAKVDFQGAGDLTEGWAIMSVAMAGLSCHEVYEVTVEMCVEYAGKAAAGRNIDLGVVVTSALL